MCKPRMMLPTQSVYVLKSFTALDVNMFTVRKDFKRLYPLAMFDQTTAILQGAAFTDLFFKIYSNYLLNTKLEKIELPVVGANCLLTSRTYGKNARIC